MKPHNPNLIESFTQKRNTIETWFEEKWAHITPPFYTSVDLRHSGFKLAPIDVNLYPAGFNNLAAEDEAFAIEQAKITLQKSNHSIKRILIITENHTRNLYYLEHLAKLKNLLQRAGFEVKLSMLNTLSFSTQTQSGQPLSLESLSKHNDYLHVGNFIPDCIILNNDLSEGLPALLTHIRQPVIPSFHLGWYQRKKSNYFKLYGELCHDFANSIDLDEWFFNPIFDTCENVNFSKISDQTALLEKAKQLLAKITQKYQDYSIDQKPYLIIKADSGSYGMGVLSIENVDSITHLSRKHRQHMAKTKGNRAIENVILQEGVPTLTQWEQHIAEPVIYFFGEKPIGGFYRTHSLRSNKENLNTPGMQLTPLTLHKTHHKTDGDLLYAYQVIARLATLAAAFEEQESSHQS